MKDKKDLFDLFRENEHKIQPTPSRHAWDKLERKLDARVDNNQTSKYRSIAQIAAVVALVSIATALAMFKSNSTDTNMAATVVKDNSTWEEIALEKSGRDSDDLVAFNKSVEAKKVLMNEGTADKKLVPKINKAKSATNKIQNYKKEELAGDIDLATNHYEMHEAPLEREMLLGEVTINKNTTIEEIEEKAIGNSNVNSNNTYADVAEVSDDATEPFSQTTEKMTEAATAAETIVLADESSMPASVTTSTTPSPASRIPQYEMTEVNAPNAKTDVMVGEVQNEFFSNRMDQISAADRRLEESVAESATKVSKKKKSRDIFSRNTAKTKRQSEGMVPSNIGIAADASALNDVSTKDKKVDPNFTWLMGTWKNVDNDVVKEWTLVGRKNILFGSVEEKGNGDFELDLRQANYLLTDKNTNLIYQFVNSINSTMVFTNAENSAFVEIEQKGNQMILRTYKMLSREEAFMRGGDTEQKELKEEVFVRQ